MIDQLTTAGVDVREALFNDRNIGPIDKVQIPAERITRLHGILFDLDPKLLSPGNPLFPPHEEPRRFYQGVRPILDRHPVARHAEVRCSGTGLHLLAWLHPAAELRSSADQERWAAIVRVVQGTLPVDPDSPGITAVTRAVGSINGKNGAVVEVLKTGEGVDPKVFEEYTSRLAEAPFKEIVLPLVGAERVRPCPVCRGSDSRLDLLDRCGFCYGSCSKVSVDQVYDVIFKPLDGIKFTVKNDEEGGELLPRHAEKTHGGLMQLLTHQRSATDVLLN